MIRNTLAIPSDWSLAHESTNPTVLTLEAETEESTRTVTILEVPSGWKVELRDGNESILTDERSDEEDAATLAERMMDSADLLYQCSTEPDSFASSTEKDTESTAERPQTHPCKSARPGTKPLDTRYVGQVTSEGPIVTVDGDPLSVRWSRTQTINGGGFAWGVELGNEDMVRLAMALLLDYYDDLAYAQRWCEPLAVEVISTFADDWEMRGAELDGIMYRLERSYPPSQDSRPPTRRDTSGDHDR